MQKFLKKCVSKYEAITSLVGKRAEKIWEILGANYKSVLIAFHVGLFIWIYPRQYKVKSQNKTTYAYVYQITSYRSWTNLYYYFYVDGIRYRGLASQTTYPDLEVGDSLLIRYYPPDPDINFDEIHFHELW